MRKGTVLALATLLVASGAPAWADTVRLRNGRVLENVRVTEEGVALIIQVEHGWVSVPRVDVAEVTLGPTRREQKAELRERLAERKLAAQDDPVALQETARWAREAGLAEDARELEATASGIELDRRLEALRDARTAAPFLALARAMKGRLGETERRYVLEQALSREPDNPDVRRELGQVQRDGAWMDKAEAERRDRERGRALADLRAEAERLNRERDALVQLERERAERERLQRELERAELEHRLREQHYEDQRQRLFGAPLPPVTYTYGSVYVSPRPRTYCPPPRAPRIEVVVSGRSRVRSTCAPTPTWSRPARPPRVVTAPCPPVQRVTVRSTPTRGTTWTVRRGR